MAPKRTRTEYEKERRREDALKENERNARARAFKRIDQSLPSEFEKEKTKFVGFHQLSAIVSKNGLVLAQRAGFLDPLKHLRVSDLESLVPLLVNSDHPFVKIIKDALEKYENSLTILEVSSTLIDSQINFEGTEDTWEESKPKRAVDICCLLIANEYDYATFIREQEEECKKSYIAKKQDLWMLNHAMRFIKEKPEEVSPSPVLHEPSLSNTLVPTSGPSKGKRKVGRQGSRRRRGRGKGRGK